MSNAYLLVYSDSTGGRNVVRNWANKEPQVLHWRYDMSHCFYIISEASANDLARSFVAHIGGKGRFLITEVTENRQGLLPAETWYLLSNKRQKPKSG